LFKLDSKNLREIFIDHWE
jgi:hypothetical protein